jgi:hypothetical protein
VDRLVRAAAGIFKKSFRFFAFQPELFALAPVLLVDSLALFAISNRIPFFLKPWLVEWS